MTTFEKKLLDLGYVKHIYNFNTKKLEIAKGHIISTMVNIDHSYILNNDTDNIIVFGLHERHKPPTLIKPRPRIEVLKNYEKNHPVIYNQTFDDSMNHCLSNETFEDIYKAMFDKSIVFKYDLR